MKVPLVSILIPAYNAEQWIAGTIQSALAQTWPRVEVIVVDDGSKDSTAAIIRRFEGGVVRSMVQEHSGASAARNTAFSCSRGDYIQWLDADDLLAPDKIAKQMQAVMQGVGPRTLLSCPWGSFTYNVRRAKFAPNPLWCDLTREEWLLRKFERNIFMQTATWLVSRQMTEEAGPWDVRLLGDDDGEYFCRVLLASNGVRFISDAKVYYRKFGFDGLSYVGRNPKKINAHWTSMKLHISHLRSIADSRRARTACVQYLSDSLMYFYPEHPRILEEAKLLASELGEPLSPPNLTWKYAWMVNLLGWAGAKFVQQGIRRVRWMTAKRVDHLLFRAEGNKDLLFPESGTLHSNEDLSADPPVAR